MKKSFKEKTLFDKRIQESEQIRNKYPDRIPIMAPASQTVGELYDNQKDEDGFLYVVYTSENTFG